MKCIIIIMKCSYYLCVKLYIHCSVTFCFTGIIKKRGIALIYSSIEGSIEEKLVGIK